MNSDEKGSLGFAIRSIQRDTMNLLHDRILRCFKIPEYTWSSALAFADCVSCKDPGYFFGGHKDSEPMMDAWAQAFANHLTLGSRPILVPTKETGNTEWKHSEHSTEWLQACDEFMRLLYVLIHLCGGGPPRVTEMIHAKLKNTSSGRRSLFLYKGYVAVLVGYTKTQSQFEKPKPIARFLDKVTTVLLLSYIIFVKPVQVFLMTSRFGRIGGTEEFLFTRHGDVMDEDHIYGFFKRLLHSMGVPFTVLSFRHFRTGIVKTYMSEFATLTDDNVALLQSGHSESTAMQCYAKTNLDFDFSGFTTAKVEAFLAVSLKWHELLGLRGEKDQPDALIKTVGYSAGDKKEEVRSRSGGTTEDSIPEKEFGNEVQPKSSDSVPTSISQQQQHLVRINNSMGSDMPMRSVTCEEPQGQAMPVTNRRKTMPSCEYYMNQPKLLLERFMGDKSADFKSKEQKAATIECHMHPFVGSFRSSLFIVLPTGGGKTVCWAAPALAEQSWCLANGQDMRINVLLVPLISLQQDMLLRLREKGLCAVLWENREEAGAAVVICSVDVVGSDAYNIFVTQKANKQLLLRFILDEVHLVPLWEHFRDFSKLQKSLRPDGIDAPLVLLTATLPASLVPYTMDLLGIEDTSLKVIRADVGRRNIKYEVLTIEELGADIIQENARFALKEMESMHDGDKIIVFCLSIVDGKAVLKALTDNIGEEYVHLYHGSMSLQERENSFNSWLQGNGIRIMVATSALSCGIDCSTVRIVIHVGGSRNLVEFAQETGRAGRNGLPSRSVTIFSQGYFNKVTSQTRNNKRNKYLLNGTKRVTACCVDTDLNSRIALYGSFKEFVESGSRCRREFLETFLNGKSREKCSASEEPCDICCLRMAKSNLSQVEEIDITGFCTTEDVNPNSHQRRNKNRATASQEHNATKSIFRPSSLQSSFLVPANVDEEYLASRMWKAKELSSLKCAVCVVKKSCNGPTFDHKVCMRARCFRCVEYPAIHQSASCDVVPRTKKGELRCYFCGIPKVKRCHEEVDFNKRRCPWLIVKNLAMMLWQNAHDQSLMLQAVPMLLPCVNLTDVCLTLCGGMDDSEKPAMFAGVDYLHRRFVIQ